MIQSRDVIFEKRKYVTYFFDVPARTARIMEWEWESAALPSLPKVRWGFVANSKGHDNRYSIVRPLAVV